MKRGWVLALVCVAGVCAGGAAVGAAKGALIRGTLADTQSKALVDTEMDLIVAVGRVHIVDGHIHSLLDPAEQIHTDKTGGFVFNTPDFNYFLVATTSDGYAIEQEQAFESANNELHLIKMVAGAGAADEWDASAGE